VPDIIVLTLSEKLAGGGRYSRRLAKYGPSLCRICCEPSIPGRLYCSDRCRWRARRGEAFTIKLDGIEARPLEHADRLGIGRSTFYRRLQLGLTVTEALTRPIDESMRRTG